MWDALGHLRLAENRSAIFAPVLDYRVAQLADSFYSRFYDGFLNERQAVQLEDAYI